MSRNAEELFYMNMPPEVSGTQQVQSTATGAAAANFDWVAGLGASAPPGKVWIEVTAETTAAWVRFKSTGAAGTTTANGALINIGEKRKFYVSPRRHNIVDHISTGVGSLKVQVASHIGERVDI